MHGDKGMTQLRHREFVADVAMTVDFARSSYVISPTNFVLFPWLASLATSFQEYCIMGMVFEFRSLAANAVSGTNAGMGSVTMSISYDVYEDDPKSKMEANNALFAVSAKPSESMMAPVECAPGETAGGILYIRQGSEGLDKHFYDFGKLHVITQGASAIYPGAGELWVTYDILVFKPIVPVSLAQRPSYLRYSQDGGNTTIPFSSSGVLINNPYGAVLTGTGINFVPGSLAVGYYFMYHNLWGTGYSTTTPGPIFTLSNGFIATPGFVRTSYAAVPWPGLTAVTNSVGSVALIYYNGNGTTAARPTILMTTAALASPTGTLSTDFYLMYLGVTPPTGPTRSLSSQFAALQAQLATLSLRLDDDDHKVEYYSEPSSPTPSRHGRSRGLWPLS